MVHSTSMYVCRLVWSGNRSFKMPLYMQITPDFSCRRPSNSLHAYQTHPGLPVTRYKYSIYNITIQSFYNS